MLFSGQIRAGSRLWIAPVDGSAFGLTPGGADCLEVAQEVIAVARVLGHPIPDSAGEHEIRRTLEMGPIVPQP